MKYTIKDIAEMSGVSKATVSRVLNNSKPVSDNVRNRVLQVIAETDFKPSHVARSLTNRETKLIGVIVPDISNPVFSKMLNGIEVEALKKHYNIIVCNSMHDIETEISCLNLLIEKQVDGIIYNGFTLGKESKQMLRTIKIPTVMIGTDNSELDFPVVKIDNYKAAYDGTNYLIKCGHKSIGIIHGPLEDLYSGLLRLHGYKKALTENSIKIDENNIKMGNYKIQDGYRCMNEFFDQGSIPSAIFCANDEMAIGAIRSIYDHNLTVPQDISILGFDDIEIAANFIPSLTTVNHSFTEKGKQALEFVINLIKNRDVPKTTTLDHVIIERESVRVI